MIDLTNRTIDEINALIQKYASVLELLKPQYQPHMALIIDIAIKYIQENHPTLETEWKAWSIVVLKHKYLKGKIRKESDIPEIIAEFIQHFKDNYADYIQQLGIFTNEYDRDYSFVCRYTK